MYNITFVMICSAISSILIIYLTFKKDKKNMLKIQVYNPIFGALSNLFLLSYSAVVVNTVNFVRNYLTYKGKLTKKVSLACIIFYIVFGIVFNTKGIIGLFPIVASASYVLFCYSSSKAQIMRYALL